MNFKRKTECSYNHFPICDDNGNGIGMLLGVKKGMSADEATALINSPLKSYANMSLTDIMSLDLRERKAVLSTVENHAKESNTKVFNGLYWDIVTDFIFSSYNLTLYDLAKELAKVEPVEPEEIYDSLRKLANSPAMNNHIKTYNKTWSSLICAYCKISEDILTKGTGNLYVVTKSHTYNMKDVFNYYESNDFSIPDLKQMIINITAVSQSDIIEVPLQIAQQEFEISKKETKIINDLIDSTLSF